MRGVARGAASLHAPAAPPLARPRALAIGPTPHPPARPGRRTLPSVTVCSVLISEIFVALSGVWSM